MAPVVGFLRPAPRTQNMFLLDLNFEEAKRRKRHSGVIRHFGKKKQKAEYLEGRKRPAAAAIQRLQPAKCNTSPVLQSVRDRGCVSVRLSFEQTGAETDIKLQELRFGEKRKSQIL